MAKTGGNVLNKNHFLFKTLLGVRIAAKMIVKNYKLKFKCAELEEAVGGRSVGGRSVGCSVDREIWNPGSHIRAYWIFIPIRPARPISQVLQPVFVLGFRSAEPFYSARFCISTSCVKQAYEKVIQASLFACLKQFLMSFCIDLESEVLRTENRSFNDRILEPDAGGRRVYVWDMRS